MSKYIEKAEKMSLPLVTLHGIVAFPSVTINFEIEDEASVAAVDAAGNDGSFVFLCPMTAVPGNTDNEEHGKLFRVGTVARIRQAVKSADGGMRIIAEGLSRATLLGRQEIGKYCLADVLCRTIQMPDEDNLTVKSYMREMIKTLERFVKAMPASSNDVLATAKSIRTPALLADFIASNILLHAEDKQKVLACFDPIKRMETVLILMEEECELLDVESEIHSRVREAINKNQKDFYLREQIHMIQDELGEGDSETETYRKKIKAAKLPQEVEEKLLHENDRLSKTPYGSPESCVLTTYLDTCLEIPWTKSTKDRTDVAAAAKILDEDHDGLEKIKQRILEYLAVRQLNPDLKNQMLCLVGPPGVGKTSIAISIARAMKRKYVRVSLGGVRDEADIRGHRKTYIGAMPGRIITALTQAKVNNPLILLDEIDKLTRDSHGDPASALLEVLDGEQNKSFRDHFVELPFDLSNCVFIATANTLETIPKPLIDRMEIIELASYTKREKLDIAKHHLLEKQMKRHGVNHRQLTVTDGAVTELIDYYTHEAGVRNLERNIADLCRKAARRILEDKSRKIVIDTTNVAAFLGPRKLLPDTVDQQDEIGTVNGLAYTEAGGSLLKVEVAVLEGNGKIELTGSLGDVMKESARIAVSYVRSIADRYGIPADFYKTKDIHIHFPEGAVPKDGPSAGVTMVTALVSALAGIPVRHDVAMTGEISLRGHVLAIGGLKEKTMAAYSAGAKTVIIPADNVPDLEEIDPLARENLTFVPCKTADEVLTRALCRCPDSPAKETETKAVPTEQPLQSGADDLMRTNAIAQAKGHQ